jgi:hypothetical protein
MNLFTGGNPTLLGNSAAGGSFHQSRIRPAQVQSAAGSLAMTAGPVNAAAQGDALRSAAMEVNTERSRMMQAGQNQQAEMAAAQSLLNEHKTRAILGECHRCGIDPSGLALPKLAQMMMGAA